MPPALPAELELVVNGESRRIPHPPCAASSSSAESEPRVTVGALLAFLELAGRRVAVAVNGAVVPRSRFDTAPIRDGDHVEVIQAVGGG